MLDAVAPDLMAVRPDLPSAWGGIEVGPDGYPAHFYFYVFCIDSFDTVPERYSVCTVPREFHPMTWA